VDGDRIQIISGEDYTKHVVFTYAGIM